MIENHSQQTPGSSLEAVGEGCFTLCDASGENLHLHRKNDAENSGASESTAWLFALDADHCPDGRLMRPGERTHLSAFRSSAFEDVDSTWFVYKEASCAGYTLDTATSADVANLLDPANEYHVGSPDHAELAFLSDRLAYLATLHTQIDEHRGDWGWVEELRSRVERAAAKLRDAFGLSEDELNFALRLHASGVHARLIRDAVSTVSL